MDVIVEVYNNTTKEKLDLFDLQLIKDISSTATAYYFRVVPHSDGNSSCIGNFNCYTQKIRQFQSTAQSVTLPQGGL